MSNLNSSKDELLIHIQNKIDILSYKTGSINYKFKSLKRKFKFCSIAIIYLASTLTLIEAFINIIKIKNEIAYNIVRFIPILLSTKISIIASIIKFNKYEDKIENITRATDRCIETIGKFKEIKEEIFICTNTDQLLNIKKKFGKDTYRFYIDSISNIDKYLIPADYIKTKQIRVRNKRIERNIQTRIDIMKEKEQRKGKGKDNDTQTGNTQTVNTKKTTRDKYNSEDRNHDKDLDSTDMVIIGINEDISATSEDTDDYMLGTSPIK